MDLATIFSPQSFLVNLKEKDKDSALEAFSSLAMRSLLPGQVEKQDIVQALKNREAQGSTGFGDGIAIPHAGIPGITSFLLFIVQSPHGVDFDSLDKKKVNLFFVILGPENKPSEHIQILAAVSRALNGTTLKKELLAATTVEVMSESFLKHAGGEHDKKPEERQKMKLLVLVLYLEEYLYHIMEYFLDVGIDGATITDSSGMGEYVSNIPLFATFIGFMNEKKNRSRTILAAIPAEREDEIINGVENILGDLDRKQGAMLMCLDISFYKGTMKMM